MLLTFSPSTVKRDATLLRRQGKFVMTRGAKHDMGSGLSHKTIIIDLYLKGYTFTEIEQKTNHSETSVKRYLADLIQIAMLHKEHFSVHQIRLIAEKSLRIVREYIDLYDSYYQQNNLRLSELLMPQRSGSEAKKNPYLIIETEGSKMSKSLTKEQIQLKKFRRLHDKSQRQLLLYKFLNEYGYEKGEITATAIEMRGATICGPVAG